MTNEPDRRRARLLIVDDEPLLRLALRSMIASSELPVEVAGEAANGRDALVLLEHTEAELVIVDVRMPVMSGIEFLRRLEDRPPAARPVCIVLSSYPDYPYVREAFLLGAFDYVAKAELDEEHVLPVIRKALARIGENGRTERTATDSAAGGSAKEELLRRWIAPGDAEAPAIWDKSAAGRLTRLGETRLALAVVLIDRYRQKKGERDAAETGQWHFFIHEVMGQVLEQHEVSFEILHVEEAEYALLFSFQSQHSYRDMLSGLHGMLQHTQRRLAEYVDVSATIGVSGIADGWHRWPELYRQASEQAAHRFFEGYGRLYFHQRSDGAKEQPAAGPVPEAVFESRKRTVESLKNADPAVWEAELAGWRQLAGASVRCPDTFAEMLKEAVWDSGAVLYYYGCKWSDLPEAYQDPLPVLTACELAEQMWEYVRDLLGAIHRWIHPDAAGLKTAKQGILSRAMKYMEQHYQESLTLSAVSDAVGVSETYLSKLFVKEHGESFVDYLTKYRIQRAIQLMKTDMKLYEISEKVGYPNAEHFSRVFKKVTGASPNDYRRSKTSF